MHNGRCIDCERPTTTIKAGETPWASTLDSSRTKKVSDRRACEAVHYDEERTLECESAVLLYCEIILQYTGPE